MPPEVEIVRAEKLRIPREVDSGRMEALKTFKTRITDWAAPSPTVYEQPVIVTIREKRERKVDGKKTFYDEYTFDHLHRDVVQFEDLIADKKAAGYTVTVKDAVLAYLLVFGNGMASVITGFLRAFPEWEEVKKSTVGQALSRLKREGILVG